MCDVMSAGDERRAAPSRPRQPNPAVDLAEPRNALIWLQRQHSDIVQKVLGQLLDYRILCACGALCCAFREAVIGTEDADDSLVWEACTRAFWGARDARGVQRYVPHWIWELAFDRRRFREAFAWAMADSRRESITVEELTSLPWEKRSKPEEVHDPNDAWDFDCLQAYKRECVIYVGAWNVGPLAEERYVGTTSSRKFQEALLKDWELKEDEDAGSGEEKSEEGERSNK